MSDTKRIFIAVPLLGIAVAKIHANYVRQVDEYMKEIPVRADWKPEQAGIHITLRFVGDVETGKAMDDLHTRLHDVARQHPPVILTMGGKGTFRINRSEPEDPPKQVLWVGVGGNVVELCHLAAQVDRTVEDAGYEATVYDFRPHVTIGRADCASEDDGDKLKGAWENTADPEGHVFPYLAREIRMYASDQMPNGTVVYTQVGNRMGLNPALLV